MISIFDWRPSNGRRPQRLSQNTRWIGLAAVGVLGVLGSIVMGNAQSDVSGVARYVVAVTLDVGGQRVSGSAVWEEHVRIARGYAPGTTRLAQSVFGEAIPLDVPDLGTVFVLRRFAGGGSGPGAGAWILQCAPRGLELKDVIATLSAFSPCRVREPRPMIAINRSAGPAPQLEQLRYVDEGGPVTLVELFITPTPDPVTRGKMDAFPWVASLPKIDLPGGGTLTAFDEFYDIDFVREK